MAKTPSARSKAKAVTKRKATPSSSKTDKKKPKLNDDDDDVEKQQSKVDVVDEFYMDDDEVDEPDDDLHDADFVIEGEFDDTVAGPSNAGQSQIEQDASNGHEVDEASDSEGESQQGSSKRSRKRKPPTVRSMSPLLNLLGNEGGSTSRVNFCTDKDTAYLTYDDAQWHPEYLYRLPADITLSCIRKSGGEGVGRVEIGQRLMMDTGTKAGNRRVSGFIVNVCNDKKEHVGQFQKMEGKIRCIKYFWKASSQPEYFSKLFDQFHQLTGRECPFKMGQVIKFPYTNLSTLRMSDISLRRVIDLLEIIHTHKVVVTIHGVLKMVEDREKARGYQFSIDKKSLLKCMKALEGEKLLNLLETVVVSENVSNKVQVMCHPSITDVNDPLVTERMQDTIDQYHKEGRVFPHGQLRYSLKKQREATAAASSLSLEPDPFITDDVIDMSDGQLDMLDRFRAYRKLTSRATVMGRHVKKHPDESCTEDGDGDLPSSPSKDLGDSKNVTLMKLNGDESLLNTSPLKDEKPSLRGGMKLSTDNTLECGYQPKAIRQFVLHEVTFQLVHGHPLGTTPTVYQKFPIELDYCQWEERSVDDLPVMVDEEGPMRFIPHLPPFRGMQRGWFMVQDLVNALPLSVYCLCAYVSKSVSRNLLFEYVLDPIKRHICLGDLPADLRIPILRDKKLYRQIEHLLLSLGALGLVAVGKSPDDKRFITPNCTLFFVNRRAAIYDTSTSDRGYSTVSLPLTTYDKYDYEFTVARDVAVFWHHFRAIVQSTPLSFRNDFVASEANVNKHKKYSSGQFDKGLLTREVDEIVEDLQSLGPLDGVGGFDSSLFLHLRRHWDVNPRPNGIVLWFVNRFRQQAEMDKLTVENRVRKLQSDWNSYVKSLMPSDLDLTKSKKRQANNSTVYPSTRASIAIEPKSKTRLQQNKKAKEWRKKKRPLDSVDIVSEQSRIHVRSRFNSREKDMLILIRAIGFFLNPVYRFWLDPTVLRDIMHEYVPESRSKTVQSLMAAGVREMVRPNRLAYLQRIVRNLSTFQEMRDLRFQLASSPLSTPESKTTFFKNAFDIANRLLFMDNQSMPHVTATNDVFEHFLATEQVAISTEQAFTNPLPLRSQKPASLAHISHCVTVNILLSMLIHCSEGGFPEKMLEDISPTVVHDVLQVLRSDGLVSRTRSMDPVLMVITKNQAVLSYYFRHFFAHRFHPDIMEDTLSVLNSATHQLNRCFPYFFEGDSVGLVVRAASCYYSNNQLGVDVPDEVLAVFVQTAQEQVAQSSKQIRYLESADLRIQDISVTESGHSEDSSGDRETIARLISMLRLERPKHLIVPAFSDWIREKKDTAEGRSSDLRAVFEVIENSSYFGASLSEIRDIVKASNEELMSLINELLEAYQIASVGVDERRFCASAHAHVWYMSVGDKKVLPRPWIMPTGDICISTIRWMSESVLLAIVASPGITLKDLCFRFDFAVQPAAIQQLLSILIEMGCLVEHNEVFESIQLSSPFDEHVPSTICTYYLPTVHCVQQFARLFGSIPLLRSMTSLDKPEDESQPESRHPHPQMNDAMIGVVKTERL